MWFDELMDDFKEAFITANKFKGIFVPIFIKFGISLIFMIGMVIFFIGKVLSFAGKFSSYGIQNGALPSPNLSKSVIINIVVFVFIAYLLILLFSALLEAGTLNLYKSALQGVKPTADDFFSGIKKYFGRILGGSLFLNIITLLLIPIIIVLFFIYALTAGILTGGLALTCLAVVIDVLFSAWTSIIVIDNIGPIKAIGRGFKFGKRYFWTIFIIELAAAMVTRYMTSAFGALVIIVAGWFIGGVTAAFFKLTIFQAYNRRKEKLTQNV